MSPNLGAEWFFDAARAYWERFRPTVVVDLDFIRLIPNTFTIVVTVVARRDTASQWGVTLAQVAPDALFDPVVENSFDALKAVLTRRAESNQPFGVPLQPTPSPGPAIQPTPGSIIGGPVTVPTREPGGFITQTPTPNIVPAEPTAAPTTAPPVEATPQPPQQTPGSGPIIPTPGPIVGG